MIGQSLPISKSNLPENYGRLGIGKNIELTGKPRRTIIINSAIGGGDGGEVFSAYIGESDNLSSGHSVILKVFRPDESSSLVSLIQEVVVHEVMRQSKNNLCANSKIAVCAEEVVVLDPAGRKNSNIPIIFTLTKIMLKPSKVRLAVLLML